MADAWVLDPIGVTVHGLSTYYGPIDYSIRRHAASDGGPRCEVVVTVGGAVTMPPGGIVLASPLARPIRAVTGDGALAAPGSNEIRLTRLPATVTVKY